MIYVPKSLLDVDEHKDCAPMSPEEANVFLQASMADNRPVTYDPDGEHREFMQFFTIAVMTKRLPERVKVSMPVVLFIGNLMSSPGDAVMWAYTLTRMFDRKGSLITMSDLATAFPWGFPTDDAKSRIWDDQKGYTHGIKCDNILDSYSAVWEPLAA
jgi:hypothetical protein